MGAGGWRASPGDRIAVDTAETGEHQPPRAGRISSKSGVSGSGGVCVNYCVAVRNGDAWPTASFFVRNCCDSARKESLAFPGVPGLWSCDA